MSDKPKRIRRYRTRGWRLPAGARCVTRPGVFGNPFVGADAVARYRQWLVYTPEGQAIATRAREELRGKDLACFCRPEAACHADVLLEVANAGETVTDVHGQEWIPGPAPEPLL